MYSLALDEQNNFLIQNKEILCVDNETEKHCKMVTTNIHQTPTIMRSVSKLQKLAVTNPVDTNFYVYYTFKILNTFGLMWNLIPEVTFFIYNLHDVKVCTSVMSMLFQLITTLFKVLYLAIRNKSHCNLFLAFETYVKQRKLVSKNGIFYDRAEKASSQLTRCVTMFMILFGTVYTLPSIALQVYLFLVQNDVNEATYISPFKHVYFYSINSNLVYILTVAMGIISISLLGITLLSIDLGFFCYCLYVEAFFKDLEAMFKLKANQDNIIQLKDAIKFHTDLLKMISQLNNLFSPIIFAQFFISTVMICTLVFQSTLHTSLQVESLKYYTFFFGATSQILIYAYFGTTILNGSYNIAMTAYSSEWTDADLKNNLLIKKYILFIIHRSQKEVGLDGLKLFKCNLQTFVSIMKASLSTLAVLQSMTI